MPRWVTTASSTRTTRSRTPSSSDFSHTTTGHPRAAPAARGCLDSAPPVRRSEASGCVTSDRPSATGSARRGPWSGVDRARTHARRCHGLHYARDRVLPTPGALGAAACRPAERVLPRAVALLVAVGLLGVRQADRPRRRAGQDRAHGVHHRPGAVCAGRDPRPREGPCARHCVALIGPPDPKTGATRVEMDALASSVITAFIE